MNNVVTTLTALKDSLFMSTRIGQNMTFSYPYPENHQHQQCSTQSYTRFNTLRPRQSERHFADDIFMCIFFNENCCILIKFSLKYVRKGPIDNNPSLVQIMAWRRSDDKPLSEPMMVSLPTHICVTRPQWVNVYLTTNILVGLYG